jgi:hypothetical protein
MLFSKHHVQDSRQFPGHGIRARATAKAAALAVTALLVSAGLSGCITVPAPNPQPSAATKTGPLSYVERLKAAPVSKPAQEPDTLAQFVTDSRAVACVFTTSRAGNLNQPWEPNNFTDQANASSPIIPVVNCELAAYPDPARGDVTDTCGGTFIGYLGGTVLLAPEKVSYGACRAGVTAMEAAFGPGGTVNDTMAAIPVLAPGAAIDSLGYRCASLDDGVACANLASGLGFFVSQQKYELFGPGHPAPTTAPAS